MKTALPVLILAMALAACLLAAGEAPAPDPLSTSEPVAVNIGGYPLYVRCSGTGGPVVLLESALGAPWSYWYPVYSRLPSTVRVCKYDRSANAHTSQNMVEDLHALLTAARLEAPYVLVGHSFGGMNTILFAGRYPQEVAGIVLEDSSHPDQAARWLAALPPESTDESSDLAQLRQQFTEWTIRGSYVAGIDFATSCDQVRTVESLGDAPLIMLGHAPGGSIWGDIPEDVRARLEQAAKDTGAELAALSSNSEQIIAHTSNHTIHRDEPELVVDAILRLVEAARRE